MASSTAARPTPPAAPSTTTQSSGLHLGHAAQGVIRRRVSHAERRGLGERPRLSGSGVSAAAGIAICSANAPANAAPNTRSPTREPGDVVRHRGDHAGELAPGMNGTGIDTWYSFATKRTSGKLTAAARDVDQRAAGAQRRLGDVLDDDASGGPYSWQRAARTDGVPSSSRSPALAGFVSDVAGERAHLREPKRGHRDVAGRGRGRLVASRFVAVLAVQYDLVDPASRRHSWRSTSPSFPGPTGPASRCPPGASVAATSTSSATTWAPRPRSCRSAGRSRSSSVMRSVEP